MLFNLPFDALPATIPVFPLAKTVIFPGAQLPLNVFEPRYLAMVDDALATPGRLVGMSQPEPDAGDGERLYPVGCAGRITAFQETGNGRVVVNLEGLIRYRLAEELPVQDGYRRFQVDWAPFRADMNPVDEDFETGPVTAALRGYAGRHSLSVDWSAIQGLAPVELTNAVSQSLPLGTEEKQLLLEAETVKSRAELLTALLALEGSGRDGPAAIH